MMAAFVVPLPRAVLNSKLALRHEIEEVVCDKSIDPPKLSRPIFNSILRSAFVTRGWEDQPAGHDE
jgi:hypothetical protein